MSNNIAEIHQLKPRPAATAWMCSACGIDAACNCGAALMSKPDRAAAAIVANPEKSDGAIAKEIGVDKNTVRAARSELGGEYSPPERIGKDGKTYPAARARHPIIEDDACADCDTEEDFWQRSLGNLAGDAVALTDQWTQQFGDWQRFEVTSDLVVLARQASDSWGNLANIMEKKYEAKSEG